MVTNITIFIWRWLLWLLTYRANGKTRSIFIVTKDTQLARNWRGITFWLNFTVYRFGFRLASVFLFPLPFILVKLVKTRRDVLTQAPPFPPTAPLSSSESLSAVLRPGIQVLGRATDGVGGKEEKDMRDSFDMIVNIFS